MYRIIHNSTSLFRKLIPCDIPLFNVNNTSPIWIYIYTDEKLIVSRHSCFSRRKSFKVSHHKCRREGWPVLQIPCRPFSATRDTRPKTARRYVIGRETRARLCDVSTPEGRRARVRIGGRRRDGERDEAYGERGGGVVPMRLGGNYPIGDVDPLIHSSANPRGTPRDTNA